MAFLRPQLYRIIIKKQAWCARPACARRHNIEGGEISRHVSACIGVLGYLRRAVYGDSDKRLATFLKKRRAKKRFGNKQWAASGARRQ